METIRQAYERALQAANANDKISANQKQMVAALAVKDAMPDTLDNKRALLVIIREINANQFTIA